MGDFLSFTFSFLTVSWWSEGLWQSQDGETEKVMPQFHRLPPKGTIKCHSFVEISCMNICLLANKVRERKVRILLRDNPVLNSAIKNIIL